ncbi:ornithine cyclodeaminase family protein [Rhodoplanes sp. SY1]|uniref:ornithine cyclodeaminase family protein n=1 Tax=Rhodoplanes sp. SY1 TaxID=3166646 RepID=UPI0038B6AA24
MTAAPPLYLTEADVAALAGVDDAIAALEDCFGAPDGDVETLPRQRAALPCGAFNLMGAVHRSHGVFGLKAYLGRSAGGPYHVLLYSATEARLVALIEADLLSQMRTGAASGLATRLMARPDAAVLAVIGTGKQAFWQAAAVAVVRSLKEIRVFGRDRGRRDAFAREVEERLGVATVAAESAEACVRGADVVVTITKASEPVCLSDWVADGAHVNAAGANSADRREVDAALIRRASLLATDDLPQARIEAAEFRDLIARGELDWSQVRSLSELMRHPPRRNHAGISLFKSLGVAIEDVAFAEVIVSRARTAGRGRSLERGVAAEMSGEAG